MQSKLRKRHSNGTTTGYSDITPCRKMLNLGLGYEWRLWVVRGKLGLYQARRITKDRSLQVKAAQRRVRWSGGKPLGCFTWRKCKEQSDWVRLWTWSLNIVAAEETKCGRWRECLQVWLIKRQRGQVRGHRMETSDRWSWQILIRACILALDRRQNCAFCLYSLTVTLRSRTQSKGHENRHRSVYAKPWFGFIW